MNTFELRKFQIEAKGKILFEADKLEVKATGFIGVIGPNGAGKSTLLRALAGHIPHKGTKSLGSTWPDTAQISYMPQHFAVNSTLSVAECVLLGRREQLGWKIQENDWIHVEAALATFGLSDLSSRRMNSLSGGQQQLVLLAQRISRNPRLLILDEPTSALDLNHQIEVLKHLCRVADKGVLVLAALHDLTLAARYCDTLMLLQNGRLVQVGAPATVLADTTIDPVYNVQSELLVSSRGSPIFVAHEQLSS